MTLWKGCDFKVFAFDRSRSKAVRNVLSLALVALFCLAYVGATAFAAGYNIYVSNEYGASVTVIDGATEEVIGEIVLNGRPGEVRPRGMAVSPDGHTIYIAQSDFFPVLETPDDRIIAIDVLTNKVVAEYWVGTNPERVDISPDGNANLGGQRRRGARNGLRHYDG